MRKGLNVKQIYSVVLLAAWFAPALEATLAQDSPSPQQPVAATARTPEKLWKCSGRNSIRLTIRKPESSRSLGTASKSWPSSGQMPRCKRSAKLKSVFLDSDKKIKALLNDEQKKQYAQVEQEMRDQIRERMQNRAAN